ncbi:hypothetical protein GCM10020331_071520 [Ectobacillus funiculus]
MGSSVFFGQALYAGYYVMKNLCLVGCAGKKEIVKKKIRSFVREYAREKGGQCPSFSLAILHFKEV